MHDALAVANYFVQAARSSGLAGKDFTPLKLHGLVYLAHGWLLGSAGAPIIDGAIAAGPDGVFIPALRDAGCWGTKNVTEPVAVLKMDDARGIMVEQTPTLNPRDATISALAWIWKTYGAMTSFAVADHLKEAGGPWDQVWNDAGRTGEEPRPIPAEVIRKWFRGLSSRREQQGRNSKLNKAQRSERTPKIEKTQQLLSADLNLRAR